MRLPQERLDVGQWPEKLRFAWANALTAANVFDDVGAGEHWAAATRRSVERGFGLYLGYLDQRSELHAGDDLAGILKVGSLKAYALFCFDKKLRPTSIATRFNMLNEAVRIMAPRMDRRVLVGVLRRLQKAQRSTPKKASPMKSASELYYAGISRMHRVSAGHFEKRDVQAVQFGDGLMMAMLAAKPFRISTLARTNVGQHLVKIGGRYVWSFGTHETKNAEASRVELPAQLTPCIDRWLEEFRPVLLKGKSTPAMWVSCYRDRMSSVTIYSRFCAATSEELGVRVNPHEVRAIVATSVAVAMPREVRIIPSLLDHRTDTVAKRHYILADGLSASDQYLASLERWREEAKRQRARPGGRS